jgi:hypothetical protein
MQETIYKYSKMMQLNATNRTLNGCKGKAKPQEKRELNLRLLTLAKTHWLKPLTMGSKDQW